MPLIKKTLTSSKEANNLVSLYTNEKDSNYFRIGLVIGFDNEFLLLKLVNKLGKFNGFLTLRIKRIFCLIHDDDHIRKTATILDRNFLNVGLDAQVHLQNFYRFEDVISICLAKPYLVEVSLHQGMILKGIIKEFDGYNICINIINEQHTLNGNALININNIDEIFLQSSVLVDTSKLS